MNSISRNKTSRFAGVRYFLVVGLSVALLLLGQFDEYVFARITQLWQAIFAFLGFSSPQPVQQISTHGLPVAVTYRLLYAGLSVLLLHLLLRGRATLLIVAGYVSILVVSVLLLLVGRTFASPLATLQAHRFIDLICSPLAIILVCVLVTLHNRSLVSAAHTQPAVIS